VFCAKISRTQVNYLRAKIEEVLEEDYAQLLGTYLGLEEWFVEFGFG